MQGIDLAVAAEEAGVDGAYFRVHHFAQQQAAPFPLLSAIAAKTSRIEIGTGVIDMRYENPLYMAEEAAATDLISGGRLQLGVSRGSPETALAGYQSFGYVPEASDPNGADLARAHTSVFRRAIAGEPMANANPQMTGSEGSLPILPLSDTLQDRIWWGAGTRATAEWTAEQGMNLMSSTLLTEDTGVPFDQLQAEQIERFRRVWAESGWERTPRVSVPQHHPDRRRRVEALLRRPPRSRARTRSGTSTVGSHASAARTSANPRTSWPSWPPTPRSALPTPSW